MATLQIQRTSTTGMTPTYTACSAGGDAYPNSSREVLQFKNADTHAHTVTIICQTPCNLGGTTVHNIPITVAPGTEDEAGPFPSSYYNDGNGMCQVTYDAVTGMSVAVVAPY